MTDYRIGAMPAQLPAELVAKLMKVETATVGHWRHWGFMDRGIQPLLKVEAGRRHRGDARDPRTRLDPAASCARAAAPRRHPGGRPARRQPARLLGRRRHGGGEGGGAVAGIVDGPCTDQLEIEQSDFPLWCRGLAPITTRLYNLGGILNGLISCGGVPVQPGDAILADESGVLVLPPDEVDTVATAAIARQERGKGNEQKVRGGAKLGDLSGASRMVTEALKANDGKST